MQVFSYKPIPAWQAEQNILSKPISLIAKEHSDVSEFCAVAQLN